MRAVWTFVVACVVAFGGAGRVEVRTADAADLVRAAPEAGRTVAIRSAAQQVPVRARARSRTRIDHGRLPPAALSHWVEVPRPSQAALVETGAVCDGAHVRWIAGGSARGPPLV